MAELLQSGQGPEGAGKAAAQSLNMLLKKSKKPTVRQPTLGPARLLDVAAIVFLGLRDGLRLRSSAERRGVQHAMEWSGSSRLPWGVPTVSVQMLTAIQLVVAPT